MAAAKSQASSQPTKQAAQPPIDDVAAADDDQSDSDSLEEGEYEIDEILSHQELPPPTGKGKQAAGPLEFEYFVSWVGYGPEFNEWVAEENFGSDELVRAYWDKLGGRPTAHTPPKPTKQSTSSRKQPAKGTATTASSATGVVAATNTTTSGSKRKQADQSVTPAASKRARPAGETAEKAASPAAAVSKPSARTTDTTPDATTTTTTGKDTPEEYTDKEYSTTHVDSMSTYANLSNWEDQVQSIETVERGPAGQLIIYMTMIGGEKTSQDSETVNARCPQKVIKFYESHLKWRQMK